MQQLGEKRITGTPTDLPHVRGKVSPKGDCGASLNSPLGRGSVTCLENFPNNPDAVWSPRPGALTAMGQAGQNPRVSVAYVLSMRGKPLMPCSPRRARVLLTSGKARVANSTPFVIQLTYQTGETKQPITLGVDAGYEFVGLSAVSNQRELYSSETQLRTDIVKLNSERRIYRRNRRSRKTWYRQSRFLNRKRPEGWLAPSIQHKLDTHLKLVDKVSKMLPISRAIVEVAAFDIQKIKNPEIEGIDYQNGEQKGFWNVREYVLYRDNHTCQHCHGKSKDKILETHHLESRQVGGDRPENFLTLCQTCHDGVFKGRIKLKVKPSKGFRAETFMTMVWRSLVDELRKKGYPTDHTFGYITKGERIELGFEKSHVNDAFVIAGGTGQIDRAAGTYAIKQVRKCNRKLFKGPRSAIKNTAPRFIYGFRRYDKVLWCSKECFIFGRRSTGYFDLRMLGGAKVHASAKAKDCRLLERARTLLIERIHPNRVSIPLPLGFKKAEYPR